MSAGAQLHLLFVQHIEIFQADIILFVEETLLLHPGHVQDVQLGHFVFQADDFFIGDSLVLEHFRDVVGDA